VAGAAAADTCALPLLVLLGLARPPLLAGRVLWDR